ncbi:uncharacterized protein J4E92_010699 [Alternaria infectoria]|uniref:uncharacterized protein n=1 Tax=Alternaria infectoria TaxID=45303 RepID=UPI00221FD6B8|nr:uncharacterized protein J4E92_010699 [Alternaria infectoria]KAI4909091.1 hypothetical protein J4E92_010699 [Alternaria infectoria]
MPPKRSHAEMSATGDEPSALDSCPQGEQLMAIIQRENKVIEICVGGNDTRSGSILLLREKLHSVCPSGRRPTYRQGGVDGIPKVVLSRSHCLEVLGLFVQWLYTGKYNELNGPVKSLDRGIQTPLLDMCESYGKDTMEWTVKAAVLAWSMGKELQVPSFQNYAMKRLFAAFSRPSERPLLTPALYEYVKKLEFRLYLGDMAFRSEWKDKGPLERALGVTIIRNWGDKAIVDQEELESWSDLFRSCDAFRDKFLEGSLLSLEERREKTLMAEDYFVAVPKSRTVPKSSLVITRKD